MLHHSDQGCTYASEDSQRILDAPGITCSMSRRGDCYDNAVMERVFSSVKSEVADRFERCGAAKMEVFDYIEVFYTSGAGIRRSARSAPPHLNAQRAWTLASLWTHRTRPQGTWQTAQNAGSPSPHTHHRLLGLKKEGVPYRLNQPVHRIGSGPEQGPSIYGIERGHKKSALRVASHVGEVNVSEVDAGLAERSTQYGTDPPRAAAVLSTFVYGQIPTPSMVFAKAALGYVTLSHLEILGE